ncbi:MAG: SusD/RagB family nutrient-binding outer membrane lipoprotein [Dysgonamonadaceae bacterium]|nr:SusD/RagB family nutrient-binding outer membrane lipoprotein [Dysgonamonadaceae bacterium]
MKFNKIKISALLLIGAVCITSCTDNFEELNRDPKNPTRTTLPATFNGILSSLPLAYNEMSVIHFGRYYFQSQQLGNARLTYSITSGVDDIWNNYYLALKDIRQMETFIASGETGQLKSDNIKALTNILLAYKTLRMTDYVGDMPFFDAGKGSQGSEFFKAKYDKQEEIYKYCIDLLKQASVDIVDSEEQYSLKNGDTFYQGDVMAWKKFANSLALRYAMQAATADASYNAVIGEILNDQGKYPLMSQGESATLFAGPVMDSHPWSYRENNNSCLGTAMWRAMSDNDNTDGSGIFDPRCYVFFEPNVNGEWKAYPQNPDNNTPIQDRGAYLTASYPNGRGEGQTEQDWANKGEGCRFSPVNFYLATNYDYIPEILMTAAEVHFLKAEAYNRGIGVTKNATTAKNEYETGIRSSITFWYDKIVTPCAKWYLHKPVLQTGQLDAYLAKEAYSSDEQTALKQIYKQMWIDAFRQPWVGFNLYRRTLETPRDETSPYNPADYQFYQMPVSESEKLYNYENYMAATQDRDETGIKLFWHK